MTHQSENTKTSILNAAKSILSTSGASALTIDKVAKKAAVSKGGVLYHFPSREKLLIAVFHRDLDQFNETLEHLRAEEPAAPGAYARAYLRACTEMAEGDAPWDSLPFLDQFRALPATLELARKYKEEWRRKIESDGLKPTVANVVLYAADGLWLAARMGVSRSAAGDGAVEELLDLTLPPGSKAAHSPEGLGDRASSTDSNSPSH